MNQRVTIIAVSVLASLLAGCDKPSPSYPNQRTEAEPVKLQSDPLCIPHLIAVADDGTKLWKVDGRECPYVWHSVYFSSAGTHTEIDEYNPATKTSQSKPVEVPNAR